MKGVRAAFLASGLCLILSVTFGGAHQAKAWTLDRYTDPNLGTPSVGIFQNSKQTDDVAGDRAKFAISCVGGVPSIVILLNQDLGEGSVSVSMTWPGEAANTEDYDTIDSDLGVYIYDGTTNPSPAMFTNLLSLIDGSSIDTGSGTILKVIVYPTDEAPINVSFDLKGFEDAYEPVGDDCGIPIPTN